MRNNIIVEAERLLVTHGFERFHFGLVAEALNCTRPNIHHHFRTKKELVGEVVVDYVARTESTFFEIWRGVDTSLSEKIEMTLEFNFRRYKRFNETETTGHPWSLIARMRGSIEVLPPKAQMTLQNFGPHIEAAIREAISFAKGRGELLADAPVDEITVLIVSIINSAGPITQDAGCFERLETLYRASSKIITHAYGNTAVPVALTS